MSTRIRLDAQARGLVLILAGVSGVDERTVARAMRDGIETVRYYEPRERLRQALADMQSAQSAAATDPTG